MTLRLCHSYLNVHFARNLNLERINLNHCSVSREIKKSKIKLTLIILISPSLHSFHLFLSLSLSFSFQFTPINQLQSANRHQLETNYSRRIKHRFDRVVEIERLMPQVMQQKISLLPLKFCFRRCLNYFSNNRAIRNR